MKYFLLTLITLSQAAVAAKTATKPPRPNILYVYVDDMGWGSIGPNGQAERKKQGLPYVRTPNIDRLASEGVNFRRGYACPVCSPSRASQQTGFHQGHTFADRNDPDNARKAMRTDDVTMGDMLSQAGYKTGYWGKWGFGGSKDHDNPTIDNVQTLPTSHGYQHVLAELHHVRAHTFFQPTLWHAPAKAGSVGGLKLVPNTMSAYHQNAAYPNTPALQNHADYPKTAYCDDCYAFAALDFVREQAQNCTSTGQPFFGLLAVQVPHGPFGDVAELPDWNKAYAEDKHFASLADQSQQWAAMVTRIDDHLGNLLAALNDPNNDGDVSDSVAENTLVIFQSDNGGPGGKNNQQLDANGGLRGVKGSVYEGGIRVPLVMRWPAKISAQSNLKAGSQTDMVVDITDLLPTFCELADVEIPVGIDGVSIAATLLGSSHQRKRDFLIHETSKSQSIIQGDFKLVRSRSGFELFDLKADQAETTDIAGQHPVQVRGLTQLLLGERAGEPKGFANTYHHWTGRDGGLLSRPENWSDYEYSNAGQVYMSESGAPQVAWTARLANTNDAANTAKADADVSFLSLEIVGNAADRTDNAPADDKPIATQSLAVPGGVHVTGRNEIRIAAGGVLSVDGGRISSLRWVDVKHSGLLRGTGQIDATVYNSGTIQSTMSSDSRFNISGDYHQNSDGVLEFEVQGSNQKPITISGDAHLSGKIKITGLKFFGLSSGSSIPVLTADQMVGKFDHPGEVLTGENGAEYEIQYSANKVTLIVK